MPAEDIKLLAGLRSGDRDATGDIVRRLEPLITRVVFRLTGAHSDTEDLVQEVFLALQRSSDRFCGESSIETWAVAIAVNRCRTFIREQQRKRKRFSQHQGTPDFAAPESSPNFETNDFIWHALTQLSQSDRELIVLRFMEEMTLDEISDLLQQRKNTLEVRIHRAKGRLAEIMNATKSTSQVKGH